jgi:ATP-dependent RNA helicase DeaD
MVTLVLSIGSEGGVGPADIVGAIANEAGVPGRVIGAIKIGERATFVDVEACHAACILDGVHGAKIRGRRTSIRPTRQGETDRRSRSHSPSPRSNADAGWSAPRRSRR